MFRFAPRRIIAKLVITDVIWYAQETSVALRESNQGVAVNCSTTAFVFTCVLVGSAPLIATAQAPSLDLRSQVLTPPIVINKDAPAFYEIRLRGEIDDKGEGRGVLILDPNAPTFDAFGTGLVLDSKNQQVRLDIKIEFVRTGRTRIKAGLPPKEWDLYRVTGVKLQAPIGLATPNKKLFSGRLLIYDQGRTIKSVVELSNPFPPGSPPLPCHPGCFPAGTLVSTPSGVERIEKLKPGSKVITLDDQGRVVTRAVKKIFVVDNDVLKLETEHGPLITTETQPLRLANGITNGAGELSKGDAILRWENGKMLKSHILSVQERFRATRVHNLVFDETTFFVANGFIVRSKPPAISESSPISR
ncbi:MAG: Hint domain-containing protein [Pirellulaceae bacterium]|nr:Hint domain-containing protein [Pirellulaceae bacterium]